MEFNNTVFITKQELYNILKLYSYNLEHHLDSKFDDFSKILGIKFHELESHFGFSHDDIINNEILNYGDKDLINYINNYNSIKR